VQLEDAAGGFRLCPAEPIPLLGQKFFHCSS
jgi:hypothetical protein